MRTLRLPDGEPVPVLGQGTWGMGEHAGGRSAEAQALRRGIELGMTLIDTAEMYGEGGAEEVVGEAIRDCRPEVFVVSKVYPHNASARGTVAACERSLRRLRTDRIDLYLLHWRGAHPLAETVAAFERLREVGKIRYWGVSNLDAAEMAELAEIPGGNACATDQVLYNPTRRGSEWDLLPWCRERHIPVMAYSPIEQGRLPVTGILADVAQAHGCSPFQIALAWVLAQPGVIAIPKATRLEHVVANARAAAIELTAADLAAIDRAFPPPRRREPLAML